MDGEEERERTAAKFGVLNHDTSVDNIGACTTSSAVVVNIVRRSPLVMRDAGKTPSSIALGGERIDSDNGILLDEFNLFQMRKQLA